LKCLLPRFAKQLNGGRLPFKEPRSLPEFLDDYQKRTIFSRELPGDRNMAELDIQPIKTYRGTWGQILGHKDEIAGTAEVEVRVFAPKPITDPTLALLESWIATAPTDQAAIRDAEDDLRAFKRNMNLPRKEAGARLHYPDVE
jgi:hypothetical protein